MSAERIEFAESLADILDAARATPADDAIKGAAKAQNLLAKLGTTGSEDDDENLGALIDAAAELGNLFRGKRFTRQPTSLNSTQGLLVV